MINYALKTRRFAGLACAVAFWLVLMATGAPAQTARPTEYQVKAAFLFNFAKFIQWPESAFAGPAAPFVFCILGDDPFGGDIDAVAGRTINGRQAVVRRLKDGPDAGMCQVLFISPSEKGRLSAFLKTLRRPGMLLVGDHDRFAAQGGMINFIVQGDNVGFEINVDAAGRAGLAIHSRLLKMAVIVHDTKEPKP